MTITIYCTVTVYYVYSLQYTIFSCYRYLILNTNYNTSVGFEAANSAVKQLLCQAIHIVFVFPVQEKIERHLCMQQPIELLCSTQPVPILKSWAPFELMARILGCLGCARLRYIAFGGNLAK